MNTNKTIVVLFAMLAAAMTGCTPSPQGVSLSEGQKKVMKENNARAAVAVTESGRLVVVNANGEPLKRCTVGSTKGGRGVEPCQGLGKDYAVQSLATFTIIRSKMNPVCWIFIDPVYGFADEICW